MRRIGAAVALGGLALAFGSCAVFPSRFGSDYAAIDGAGLFGGIVGGLVAFVGLALLLGPGGSPDRPAR